VERVFVEHHQLTLQYLTDEVLKLKHTAKAGCKYDTNLTILPQMVWFVNWCLMVLSGF